MFLGESEGEVLVCFFLIRLAILRFIFIVEHRKVALIARRRKAVFFEGLKHRATRFVGVRAVAEAASSGEAEEVAEEMGHFLPFKLERAKAFDAGDVDECASLGQVVAFGEGGGVHARFMGVAD